MDLAARPMRPGPGPDGPPGRPPESFPQALVLPRTLEDRYTPGELRPYFAVWLRDGALLKAVPSPPRSPAPKSLARGEGFLVRHHGTQREVVLNGPEGCVVLVGRSISREISELERLAWQIALTGLGVFTIGLIGGWWLSSRAVRPIRAISTTVASITASNLSRRIDLSDVDTEPGQLGSILNVMLHRLEFSFDQQSRFIADASHELRTPLSVMLTHLELALSRTRSTEEYQSTLETCLRAARRMKILVDDLLTLARIDSGKLELRSEIIHLENLIRESAQLMEAQAVQRNL